MFPDLVTVKAELFNGCQQIRRGFGAHIFKPGLAYIIRYLAVKIAAGIVESTQAYQELVSGRGLDLFPEYKIQSVSYGTKCFVQYDCNRMVWVCQVFALAILPGHEK